MRNYLRRILCAACVLFAVAANAVRQQPVVTGSVVDEAGHPIAGATVLVAGTSRVAITDSEGLFSVEASSDDTLTFSFFGYTPQNIVPGTRSAIDVSLVADAQTLDDVVVVGYGVQKKSVVTAAISRVGADQLVKNNPADTRYALQGKVSGVQITSNSGQPGAEAVIRIRGNGTINNSAPLMLVDGFPAETDVITTLNPSDIASIEILKDAASAAIYGARAANGVVLITTKSGQMGKAKVTYNFTYGMQNPRKELSVLGASDYEMLIDESYDNAGIAKPDGRFPTGARRGETDWQDLIFNRNAPIVNHNLSVSGGNDNASYYLSLGILNYEGIIAKGKSDFNRYNIRANTTMTVFENKKRTFLNKVTVGANIAIELSDRKGIDENQEFGGVISSAVMAPPNVTPYEDDPATLERWGTLNPNYITNGDGRAYSIIDINEISNPLAAVEILHQNRNNQAFSGNFFGQIDILPGLSFKTTLGGRYGYQQRRDWSPVYYLNSYRNAVNSTIFQEKRNAFRWQWNNVLTFNHTFNEVHNVTAVVGTEAMKNQWEWLDGSDEKLIMEDDDKAWIDSATGDRSAERINGSMEQHIIASTFARLGYNYDEKYMIEGTIRRDGSSNFAPNKRFAVFPAVSAGWVITRENFMERTSGWLNFAKLRFSWGQNGNEDIGRFHYTSSIRNNEETYTFGSDKNIYIGSRPSRLANPEVTWETSEQIDLGLDLSLFKSALSVSVDLFDKRTKDMLMELPLPNYLGNGAPYGNLGTMSNKGVEVELGYRFRVGEVNFSAGGNVSYIKNEVVNIGKDRTIGGDGWNNQTLTRSENGYPFKYFYGQTVEGIFRTQAEIDDYINDKGEKIQPMAVPGDFKFRDNNADGVINANDNTYIGQSNPSWLYGFTLNADWNNFDFSIFLQGQAGNMIYDASRRLELGLTNYRSEWLDRFHATKNPDGKYPRVTFQDNNNNFQINNFFLHKGDFVRVKNIQVGYTLPVRVLSVLGISKLRVFASVENAFTFTSYKGFDPEVGNLNGIDKNNYPQARIVNMGVNVAF